MFLGVEEVRVRCQLRSPAILTEVFDWLNFRWWCLKLALILMPRLYVKPCRCLDRKFDVQVLKCIDVDIWPSQISDPLQILVKLSSVNIGNITPKNCMNSKLVPRKRKCIRFIRSAARIKNTSFHGDLWFSQSVNEECRNSAPPHISSLLAVCTVCMILLRLSDWMPCKSE